MTYKTFNCTLIALLCCIASTVSAQSLNGANAAFDREDYNTALGQYQSLAANGDKFAQYRYAMMHYFGLGTQQDLITAYSWMTTAAEDQTVMMKKFQILIWNEMDWDQRDVGTEKAIKNEMKAGTEVVDRRSRRDRIRYERSKCVGSRVGSCGAIESFGLSFSNREIENVENIPHAMNAEEIQAFDKQYSNVIVRDFVKFDKQ